MQYRKVLITICLMGCSLVASFSNAEAEEDQRENHIQFLWSFGSMTGPESNRRYVPVTQDTKLRSGDELGMMFEVKSPCYIYIVYLSAQEEITVLFPDGFDQFSSDSYGKMKHFLPSGDDWYVLDDQAGKETFYLIASSKRLFDLESLLLKYEKTALEKQPSVILDIVQKIAQLKGGHRNLSSPVERPIPIAGRRRGPKLRKKATPSELLGKNAIDIVAREFYSRTFALEHE